MNVKDFIELLSHANDFSDIKNIGSMIFGDLATKIGVSTTALAGFAGTAVGLIATFALLDLAFTSAAEATENYNNASKAYDEAKEKVKKEPKYK